MSFYEIVLQSFSSLKHNKLRTFLTMLGIIMGVFSIIAIVAIGDAAKSYMGGEFEKLGTNVVTIQAGNSTGVMMQGMNQSDIGLELSDMEIVKKVSREIIAVDAQETEVGRAKTEDSTVMLYMLGVTSRYKTFTTFDMLAGRFITEADVSSAGKICVIDNSSADKYFPNSTPIGKYMHFSGDGKVYSKFKIVGVYDLDDNGMMGMMMEDPPIIAYIPITSVLELTDGETVSNIKFSANGSEEELKELGDKVVKVLNYSRGEEDAFSASTNGDMLSSVTNILDIISMVLLVIAIITLIVGGIGIVNILLVSVSERVREIGIRKALGAKKKDIILQFIAESVTMTGLGGLIGIVFGLSAGALMAVSINIPPTINYGVVIMSFLGTIVLGMMFGVYPAKKAADLDPIEALRAE